eukprot:COSAG05_NODE_7305_length_830_cov_1.061560_2_plen_136_part_01
MGAYVGAAAAAAPHSRAVLAPAARDKTVQPRHQLQPLRVACLVIKLTQLAGDHRGEAEVLRHVLRPPPAPAGLALINSAREARRCRRGGTGRRTLAADTAAVGGGGGACEEHGAGRLVIAGLPARRQLRWLRPDAG